MRRAGLASPFLVIALAACASVGPSFDVPRTPAPERWSDWHAGAPALAAPAGAESAHLPQDRWAVFDDPVLSRLQSRALAANADVATAASRFAQSRAQRATVAAQRGPQLSGRGSLQRERQSENGSTTRFIGAIAPDSSKALSIIGAPFTDYQAGFDASWELDLWGRVRRSVEAADADNDSAAANLREARTSVAAELARAYFELRSAQRQAALLANEILEAEGTASLVQVQFERGVSDASAGLRQQSLIADLRARLAPLLNAEATGIRQIALLCGEQPVVLQTELHPLPQGSETATLPDLALGLPADFARHRPDIAAAEARLHMATANIGVAIADLYPRITLGASFGLEATSGAKFGDWASRQWSIGPSLSLPIFDQGRRRATVTLRELQQQEAAVAFQQTVLKAWSEIDGAVSTYNAERLYRDQIDAKVRSSNDALQLAVERQRFGFTDFLPLLDAQRTLLEARRERAESTGRLYVALAGVYKSLGDDDSPVQGATQVDAPGPSGGSLLRFGH